MPAHRDIARALQAHKEASGESYRAVAARAGVPTRSLTAILQGHAPSVDRAADICEALGLEFYVGPPRRPAAAAPAPPERPAEAPAFAPAEDPDFAAVVAALADEYQANNERGRRSLIARFWGLFPELRGGAAGREGRRLARRWGSALLERERRQSFGARPVEVLEFAAGAGDGSAVGQEPRAGVVWFRRDWLQRLGLDAAQCAMLRVQGESMEPTVPAGSSILVDRSRTRRRDGEIFALRTAEGMVVKRAVKGADGGWQLASDHAAWEPVAFPADAVIVGRVVWTARALV